MLPTLRSDPPSTGRPPRPNLCLTVDPDDTGTKEVMRQTSLPILSLLAADVKAVIAASLDAEKAGLKAAPPSKLVAETELVRRVVPSVDIVSAAATAPKPLPKTPSRPGRRIDGALEGLKQLVTPTRLHEVKKFSKASGPILHKEAAAMPNEIAAVAALVRLPCTANRRLRLLTLVCLVATSPPLLLPVPLAPPLAKTARPSVLRNNRVQSFTTRRHTREGPAFAPRLRLGRTSFAVLTHRPVATVMPAAFAKTVKSLPNAYSFLRTLFRFKF